MIFLRWMARDFRRRSPVLFLALLSLFCSPSFAYVQQDAPQGLPERLLMLSREIHSCAEDLNQQSNRLTEQYSIALNDSKLSLKTVEKLKAEQKDWISSSLAMNKKFTDLSTKCVEQATELKIAWKIIWTLISVLLGLITAFAILVYLEKKKITDML